MLYKSIHNPRFYCSVEVYYPYSIGMRRSPNSHLQMEGLRAKEDVRYPFNAQAASLNRRIFKKHKIDIKSLAPLKGIYLVMIGKERAISKINPVQQKLLERLEAEV